MFTTIVLIFFICTQRVRYACSIEHSSSEQIYTVTSVPMQSVVLPCKAVLPYQDPERVMWYKLINSGQSSTLSVSNQLITKDSRFSVAYYSIDHGFSPAKWDLHITNVRLSDAAHYQCHVTTKDNRKSIRSNVKLVVEDILVDIHPTNVYVSIGDTAEFSCNFTGQHRVRSENVTWLKDDKPLANDATRVTTSTEYLDMTVTNLKLVASHMNDSGSYRCSDGYGAQSQEAKLHIQEIDQQISFHLLSSSSSSTTPRISSFLSSFRTVFYAFICHFSLFYSI